MFFDYLCSLTIYKASGLHRLLVVNLGKSQKFSADFQLHGEFVPLSPMLFKSQLYTLRSRLHSRARRSPIVAGDGAFTRACVENNSCTY